MNNKKEHLGLIPPQEIMSATEHEQFTRDFEAHFKQETLDHLEPIRNTRREVQVQDLQDRFDLDDEAFGGLYIGYGLYEGSFLPILERVVIDATEPRGFAIVKDTAHVPSHAGLHAISDTVRQGLVAAYTKDVKVKRTVGGQFEVLAPKPHALGIHFTGVRINALLQDNPIIIETRQLVITCLGADLIADGDVDPTFHHTTGLHVATLMEIGGAHVYVDQLDDVPNNNHVAMRAIDYGYLCPPHCLRRK